MIRFIVTPGHEYTFAALAKEIRGGGLDVRLWNYRQLFEAESLDGITHVFCDIERLADWELGLAGEIARLIREAGCRVLNDPARAASRYELLLRLHQAGFNDFRAWRAEDGIPPARYPVFLRLEANHSRPVSDLIHTPEELATAIEARLDAGAARRGMLIVEYEGEECVPGIFRKYAAYRFGDRIVADHIVNDVVWAAKYGNEKARYEGSFAAEAAFVRDNPHAEALMRAFEIGGIEYGRADYNLVGGKIQIYEINTNAVLPRGNLEKALPERVEATALSRDNRLAAIRAMAEGAEGSPILLKSEILDAHRERQVPGRPDIIRE